MKNWMCLGVILAGTMLSATSCLDKDYDLNNLDLTLGLGSEGLSVKVGETEKIFLKDILEVDNTIKVDGSNLYYLEESGTSDYNFSVEKVTTSVSDATISSKQRVLSFESALEQMPELDASITEFNVPADFAPTGYAEGAARTDLSVDNISSDVKSLSRVYSNDLNFSLSLEMVTSPGVNFKIRAIKNFKIKVPSYLHITRLSDGWVLKENNLLEYPGELTYNNSEICSLTADYVDLGEYGIPVNNSIVLGDEMVEATASGEVDFYTVAPFTMRKGDFADAVVTIKNSASNNQISIDAVTGRFNPVIDVAPQQIDIAGSLPDFLKDEAVRVSVSNPTIKLSSDMTAIPLGVNVSAELQSVKNGADGFTRTVGLPKVAVDNNQMNTVYYYQGNAPYDPEGVVTPSKQQLVGNLSTLLERLPDYINVDFGNGKVAVQDKDYTITLGQNYNTSFNYKVYVPFEFSDGLTIVYNDSTDSFEDDLADYTAEGVTVMAEAYSSIPLELVANLYAVDVNGNEIPDIHFEKAFIAPSADGKTEQRTDVKISARLEDPALLQKIDRLFFKINATSEATQTSHKLYSTQYLQFKEMKLRLDGQVTGNFN